MCASSAVPEVDRCEFRTPRPWFVRQHPTGIAEVALGENLTKNSAPAAISRGWPCGSSRSSRPGRSMRGRNGTCAWLPHSEQRTAKYSRVGAAALVAARAAEVGGGVAGVAGGAPAGTAAHAALGVGGEPLLRVVPLVVGGVDELRATVDAGQGSIGVGHEEPPERVDLACCDAPEATPSATRRRPKPGAARPLVPILESLGRAHRVNAGEGYPRIPRGSVSESKPCQSTCHNGARPFAAGERGAIGGASLARPIRRTSEEALGEAAREDAATAPHGRRAPRARATRTSVTVRRRSASASSPPSSRRSIWPSPRRSTSS